jgi:hypothetical protein
MSFLVKMIIIYYNLIGLFEYFYWETSIAGNKILARKKKIKLISLINKY